MKNPKLLKYEAVIQGPCKFYNYAHVAGGGWEVGNEYQNPKNKPSLESKVYFMAKDDADALQQFKAFAQTVANDDGYVNSSYHVLKIVHIDSYTLRLQTKCYRIISEGGN